MSGGRDNYYTKNCMNSFVSLILLAVVLLAGPACAAQPDTCRSGVADLSGSYALCGDGLNTSVAVINSTGGMERGIPIGAPATGIMASMKPGLLLVYFQSFTPVKIGMDVSYALYTLDVPTGALKQVFKETRIGYGKHANPSVYRGWAATASPTDTEALLVDYVRPPNVAPHLRLRAVDYMKLSVRDIGRTEMTEVTNEASWSPDGRHVALRVEGLEAVHALLDTETGDLKVLDGPGIWDPTGVSADVKAKIFELKTMAVEGLISDEEYRTRRAKLINVEDEPQ